MTDEAPKEIWAWPKGSWFTAGASDRPVKVAGAMDVKYLRADLAHALVAEAYEVCAGIYEGTFDTIARLIRDKAPADAIAAREADRKQVREQALREALEAAREMADAYGPNGTITAIRFLIKKDKTNDG